MIPGPPHNSCPGLISAMRGWDQGQWGSGLSPARPRTPATHERPESEWHDELFRGKRQNKLCFGCLYECYIWISQSNKCSDNPEDLSCLLVWSWQAVVCRDLNNIFIKVKTSDDPINPSLGVCHYYSSCVKLTLVWSCFYQR